ncbi:hypothetical protein DZF91_15035 [Actinomadura logoneensis]|uniref:Uncharacterized protein n=1 Tax=Actinomadura logoneensis TaxID=2293572 RepID=A0A372JLY0_9ACTN|nr:hypothetical protein [Actinomadura logoneensis]RFU40844.1 hypothetical protein DZF91_15035 [Actinomadura logoneensis]
MREHSEAAPWFAGRWSPGLEQVLLAGPGVVLAERHRGQQSAVLEAIPWSGICMDVPRRRLDWWSLECAIEVEAVNARWPGWTLTDHGDRFEDVTPLAGPELLIDAGTQTDAAHRVHAALLSHPRR